MIELNLPAGVRGVMTTRSGGISKGQYASNNLGAHVQDDPVKVEFNRARLTARLGVPLAWMNQVHGHQCAYRTAPDNVPTADAQWTDQKNIGLTVGVADCLPVGLAQSDGQAIAVAHAGWRGLAEGVIESALEPLQGDVVAVLGPCIGPGAFQVGLKYARPSSHKIQPGHISLCRIWVTGFWRICGGWLWLAYPIWESKWFMTWINAPSAIQIPGSVIAVRRRAGAWRWCYGVLESR